MRDHARMIFDAAVQALEPGLAIKRHMRLSDGYLEVDGCRYELGTFKDIYVVGGGKANAPMAQAVEELLDEALTGGIVSVKHGHGLPLEKIDVRESGHPVPDESGMAAALDMLSLVEPLDEDSLVICLLSGGGSALLPVPADGITLEDKQATTRQLLACGATIEEVNAVRKHLSRIKGGQLARAAWPASIVTLVLSDVIGDPLDAIASGPTVPDGTTFQDVSTVVRKYGVEESLPDSVTERIQGGVDGRIEETPKSGDPIFEKTQSCIIGNNRQALAAAAVEAKSLGYNTLTLSSSIEGETVEIARMHAAIAREVSEQGQPITKPACILSGGETTVKVQGDGKGGRNQEFALAAARGIGGLPAVVILSGGTDGSDGPTDAAGAFADGSTMERAHEAGLDLDACLARNDSYSFFDRLGDLLRTGPTRTNVMDVRIMLIGDPGP